MRAYGAFVAKELMESFRNYRLMILLAVFLIFGMMSPLTAKLLPELLSSMDLGGAAITLPEPTAMDSWMQFFKNIGQMGLLVLVIIFAGITANELSSATLINMLTKGMKRSTVLLSKMSVAFLIWTASYALSFAAAYVYTAYFWDTSNLQHAAVAFLSPWLFGLLLIQLLVLGGILFKSFVGSLLSAGGAVVVLTLLNLIPAVQKCNPLMLIGDNTVLLTGAQDPSSFLPALLVCVAMIVAFAIASIVIFNKKQL